MPSRGGGVLQARKGEFRRKLENLLEPFKDFIQSFQSILLAQRPLHYAVFLVFLHLLIWLGATLSEYSVLSLLGFSLIVYSIGGLITENYLSIIRQRLPAPIPDAKVQVLPFSDVVALIVQLSFFVSDLLEDMNSKRSSDSKKFAMYTIAAGFSIFFLGILVPGWLIVWITAILVVVVPPVIAHDIPALLLEKAGPKAKNQLNQIIQKIKPLWHKIEPYLPKVPAVSINPTESYEVDIDATETIPASLPSPSSKLNSSVPNSSSVEDFVDLGNEAAHQKHE